MTSLIDRCKLIISDSGGVSKEASFVGKKCFFPLKLEVWPELIEAGYITMVDIENPESVKYSIEMIKEVLSTDKILEKTDFFGNGNAAAIIVDTIQRVCGVRRI